MYPRRKKMFPVNLIRPAESSYHGGSGVNKCLSSHNSLFQVDETTMPYIFFWLRLDTSPIEKNLFHLTKWLIALRVFHPSALLKYKYAIRKI